MQITSFVFILFTVLLTVVYYAVPKKVQWIVLLVFSLLFYCMGGLESIGYIFVTIFTTYLSTILITAINEKKKIGLKSIDAKDKEAKQKIKALYKSRQKAVLIITLILNFGILCYFKYTNFILSQFGDTFKPLDLIIPFGISFYTFQSMGYLLDVYWEKAEAEKNPIKLMLFISFFPQITQGPISEFKTLHAELFKEHSFSYENFSYGCQRMIWGFFKKMVVADSLAPFVNDIFAGYASYHGVVVLLGAFSYSIQIYADFSGYMDIMCGLCQVLDIKLTENFERPYFSKSVAEYWRRWHISLGAWFKTYIYYPMAFSKGSQKLGKKISAKWGKNAGRNVPATLALIVVWFTTGIWHGASWAYAAWGLVNGLFIIFSLWMEPVYDKWKTSLHINSDSKGWRNFCVIRTFILITFIKVLPEVGTLSDGIGLWKRVFTDYSIPASLSEMLPYATNSWDYLHFAMAMAGALVMLIASILGRKGDVRIRFNKLPMPVRTMILSMTFIIIILFGVAAGQNGGFMYARF